MKLHSARKPRLTPQEPDFSEMKERLAGLLANPNASARDFLPLLGCPGVIGEQAMFALYRKAERDLPQDPTKLVTDAREWDKWLAQRKK